MKNELLKSMIKNLKKLIKSEKTKHFYDSENEHLYNINYIENCIYTIQDIMASK